MNGDGTGAEDARIALLKKAWTAANGAASLLWSIQSDHLLGDTASRDTFFALGKAMGAVDQLKSLIGRDVDHA